MTVEHACPACGTEIADKYIYALMKWENHVAYRKRESRKHYLKYKDRVNARCREYYHRKKSEITAAKKGD